METKLPALANYQNIITLDFVKNFISNYEANLITKQCERSTELNTIIGAIDLIKTDLLQVLKHNFPTANFRPIEDKSYHAYMPPGANISIHSLSGEFESAKAFKWHLEFYKLDKKIVDQIYIDNLFNYYFDYTVKDKPIDKEDIVTEIFRGIQGSILYREKLIIKNNPKYDSWVNNPPAEYTNADSNSGNWTNCQFVITMCSGKIFVGSPKDLITTSEIYDNIKNNILGELKEKFNIDYLNFAVEYEQFLTSIYKIIKWFFIDQEETIKKIDPLSYSPRTISSGVLYGKKTFKVCDGITITKEREIEDKIFYNVDIEGCSHPLRVILGKENKLLGFVWKQSKHDIALLNSVNPGIKMSVLYFNPKLSNDLDENIKKWQQVIDFHLSEKKAEDNTSADD